MPVEVKSLLKLVASGGYRNVEEAWMAAVEDPETKLPQLVPVLKALVKAGQTESAELLGWSTVSEARERLNPPACLDLIKSMFIAVPDSEDLRAELIDQYKIVHADLPHIDQLIQACGLADGSKKPRLALRTLELCLFAKEGSYLLSRQDDSPAEVVAVSDDCRSYTVRFNHQTRDYKAAELASEFRPADRDDFRVLTQWQPDRLQELLDRKPAALIASILKARGGRGTADDLRFTICPRFLSPEEWSKWWTKARAALKKDRTVRLEGRSPVTLVYDPGGWTIEDLSWENFPKNEATSDYYDAVESYLREAKSRKLKVSVEHLSRMAAAIQTRNRRAARHAPDSGLGMTLVLERLTQHGAALRGEPSASADTIVAEAEKPAEVLGNLTEARLWPAALEAAKKGCPDTWPEVFAELLPRAPMQTCERIAAHLRDTGRSEMLNRCVEYMMQDPAECMEAVGWVWKGSPHLEGVAVPARLELLTTMLNTLGDLQRDGGDDQHRRKRVRETVKNALGAAKYRGFKECLDSIDQGMASALRNRIRRLDGLGVVLVENLIEEIRKRFPGLWVQKKEAAWRDSSVIYCTEAGMQKLEKEVEQVVNVEMPANAKAIGEAAAHGDLSENAEYRFALEARDMLRARLAKLQQQLSMARIIDPDDIPTDHVGVGARVTIRPVAEAPARTLTFLGPWEAAVEQDIYNYQAPLSQRLMGRSVGETVWLLLEDTEAEWTIERIEPSL